VHARRKRILGIMTKHQSPLTHYPDTLLEKWTTNSNLQRGKGYFESGSVINIKLVNSRFARGIVKGNRTYRVFVEIADKPEGLCSCAYNSRGLCKHMVALLIALNARNGAQHKNWPRVKERMYQWLNRFWILGLRVLSQKYS